MEKEKRNRLGFLQGQRPLEVDRFAVVVER